MHGLSVVSTSENMSRNSLHLKYERKVKMILIPLDLLTYY